jgi:enoyl-CoA hydratase
VRNALNLEMCNELLRPRIGNLESRKYGGLHPRKRPAFCGGADLNVRKGKSESGSASAACAPSRPTRAGIVADACIALVHGAVIGSGVEIAAACDFIVATPAHHVPHARGAARHGRRHAAPAAHPRQAPGEGPDVHRPGIERRRGAHRRPGRQGGGRSAPGSDPHRRSHPQAPPLALKLAKRTIDRGLELDPAGALQAEIEAIEEQLAAGQWMGKT